ncbi:MAG TPA: NUDIX domain-containing protein [Spirochaetia bacterium]
MKKYSFCPVCGASLSRAAGEAAPSVLLCPSCGFEFWQNSKPAVAAVVLDERDGRKSLLMTRRAIDPFKGWWDLPGGFLDNGEQPLDGLARELREELGVVPRGVPTLLGADIDEYPRDDMAEEARFVLSLFYRCELAEDARLSPADDVTEAAWFPLDALPSQIAFPIIRRFVESFGRLR